MSMREFQRELRKYSSPMYKRATGCTTLTDADSTSSLCEIKTPSDFIFLAVPSVHTFRVLGVYVHCTGCLDK